MEKPYYLSATRVGDIPIEILVALHLCRLWEPPDFARHPTPALTTAFERAADRNELREAVQLQLEVAEVSAAVPPDVIVATKGWAQGVVSDADLVSMWAGEVRRRARDAPYKLGCAWHQLPHEAKAAAIVPSLIEAHRRHLAGLPLRGPLAARPLAPADAPRSGPGPASLVIVGDPADAKLPKALQRAAELLGERAGRISWVWMHGPTSETPEKVVAGLQRDFLLRSAVGMDVGQLGNFLAVQGVKFIPMQSSYPKNASVVLEPLAILDACGVPRRRRPALIVDRNLFLGMPDATLVEALDAAGHA